MNINSDCHRQQRAKNKNDNQRGEEKRGIKNQRKGKGALSLSLSTLHHKAESITATPESELERQGERKVAKEEKRGICQRLNQKAGMCGE